MRTLTFWIATSATCSILGLPLLAAAHTGGALDAEGCHADHRKGTYHCHRGEAAGYTFPNREAMQEAVRTGKFPEKSVDEEGFFSKLWPFGKKHEQQAEPETSSEPVQPVAPGSVPPPPPVAAPAAGAAPATGAAPASDAAPTAAAAPAAVAPAAPAAPAAPLNEYEKRLKVLQGLYEMGLLTREEYEAKRKEVLGQL